jgi:hypothetical protein
LFSTQLGAVARASICVGWLWLVAWCLLNLIAKAWRSLGGRPVAQRGGGLGGEQGLVGLGPLGGGLWEEVGRIEIVLAGDPDQCKQG